MHIRLTRIALLAVIPASLVPFSAKAQFNYDVAQMLDPNSYSYEETLSVTDPDGITDPSYLNYQSELVYDRLITDYAFRNPWKEGCLQVEGSCSPERINSEVVLQTVWDGLPREIGSAARRARECVSQVSAADLGSGDTQGAYTAAARMTVIDVVRGVTLGIPGFVLKVGQGAATGAAKATQRIC